MIARLQDLNKLQRLWLVDRLACMDSVPLIRKDFAEQFGTQIDRELVYLHDAGNPRSRKRMPDELSELFDRRREEFLQDIDSIAVAHKVYRLRVINRLLNRQLELHSGPNAPIVMELLEQAAKEMGGAYTNKAEHSGTINVVFCDDSASDPPSGPIGG